MSFLAIGGATLGGVAGAAGIGGLSVGSGALLGAGLGGLAGNFFGGGGGGGGQTATAVPTGLASPFLGQTLGQGIRTSGSRGVKFSKGTQRALNFQAQQLASGRFGDPLFAPASQEALDWVTRRGLGQALVLTGPAQSRAINEFLLQPTPLTNIELGALGLLGQQIPGGITFGSGLGQADAGLIPESLSRPFQASTSAQDYLLDVATPAMADFLGTGRPVSIDPIARAAQARFRSDLLPEIAENFGVSRFGTGFQNVAQREARRIAEELGRFDYGAQEAARARQLQSQQLLPALQAAQITRAAFPITFSQDLLGLGTNIRETLEGQRPAERLLPFLQGFPMETITRGVKPTSTTGDVLSALAEIAPAIISAGGGFGPLFGGPTAAQTSAAQSFFPGGPF